MKTGKGLATYARAQIGKPYWWGCFGQLATPGLLAAKRAQYPEQYNNSDFDSQMGQKVHDCVGLIKGYLWCNSPEGEPRYNGSQDVAVRGLYEHCSRNGPIETIPDIPGVCVFRADMGHVGVYVGGDKIVEAMGHRYGVVSTQLPSSRWAFWGMPDWIDYSDTHIDPVQPGILWKKPKHWDNIRMPLLKEGMKHPAVRRLQQLLNAEYNLHLEEDGEYGKATKAAVTRYQKDTNQLADGECGINTWTSLMHAT